MQRVGITWSAPQGGPYYSNLYFSGVTASDATEAHGRVSQLLLALDQDISSAYTATVDPEVAEVDTLSGLTTDVYSVPAVSQVGTSAGQPLPFTTQGLVKWSTGFYQNGRAVRGRFFVPGFTENATQGGKPDPAFVTSINNAVTTWLGTLTPAAKLVVYSRTHRTATVVTKGALWTQWAVLRSRRD